MLNITPDFWQFVDTHLGDDTNALRLKYHGRQDCGFDLDLALTQIECRKRFGKKLSETLTQYPHWLFANTLAGEQSTSDRLAAFHAGLVGDVAVVADLTAGLGIDAQHLSRKAKQVFAVEIDALKAEALEYNFGQLPGPSDVQVVNRDCREWVGDAPHCGCMFIDPARRAADGSRVFALAQCQPDVTAMMPMLQQKTDSLVIKLSPMLDITQTFRELPQAHTIISLGTETECKELIALVDFRHPVVNRIVQAVTLKNDGTVCSLSFNTSSFANGSQTMADNPGLRLAEGMWLYDPYPAVMKAGPYRLLCELYDVRKPSPNTHLYFSDTRIDDFPGLCLQVERVIPFNSKYIKRLKAQYPKLNVITRNFDMSVRPPPSETGSG